MALTFAALDVTTLEDINWYKLRDVRNLFEYRSFNGVILEGIEIHQIDEENVITLESVYRILLRLRQPISLSIREEVINAYYQSLEANVNEVRVVIQRLENYLVPSINNSSLNEIYAIVALRKTRGFKYHAIRCQERNFDKAFRMLGEPYANILIKMRCANACNLHNRFRESSTDVFSFCANEFSPKEDQIITDRDVIDRVFILNNNRYRDVRCESVV